MSFYKKIDSIDTHIPEPAPKRISNLGQIFISASVVFADVLLYVMSDDSRTQRVFGVNTNELSFQTELCEKYYNENFGKLAKVTQISA